MTTNAGAADLAKEVIGFGRSDRIGDDTEAINKMFTPEFRNRLDATIGFAGLSPAIITRVVEKFIMQLEVQLEDRNVTIDMTDKARAWIGEKGYDKHYGARPLGRMIQEHIKKPLAEELLFGTLVKGGLVKIGLKNGQLTFKYGTEGKLKPSKPRKPGTPKGKSGGGGSKVPELVQ